MRADDRLREAIHRATRKKDGLLRRGACHRAAERPDPLAPRNDVHTRLRDLAARCAEPCSICPPENRRRREDRVRAAPASRARTETKETAHEHTGSAEASSLPCAMALRLITRSPRRIGLVVSVAPRSSLLENLTPTIERQDHTALPYATCSVRLALPSRPPHPIPRFVTIAIRPSCRVRRASF